MMTRRPIFFIGVVYELFRFGFLFIFGLGILTPAFDQVYILMIMILSSPALLMAAGFLVFALFPESYFQFRKLLALGKLLEMLPLLFALLNSIGIITFAGAERQFANVGLLFAVLLLLDLLFFFFLVSYKRMNEIEVKEQ